jgi:hypothetical protein
MTVMWYRIARMRETRVIQWRPVMSSPNPNAFWDPYRGPDQNGAGNRRCAYRRPPANFLDPYRGPQT